MRDLIGPKTVVSVFFGGGTPSLMRPDTAEAVINEIAKNFQVVDNIEITMEANPSSVEQKRFKNYREAGVNRVSLGVQSLLDEALQFLGRRHSAAEGRAALQIARDTFDRVSFDLIYARPEQKVKAWQEELESALELAGAGHLSLYQLTIEPGTAFETQVKRGAFRPLDDDRAADLYELTQNSSAAHGLAQYEISNYARPGEESVHNKLYWTYSDTIGVGPGAHGRLTLDRKKVSTRAHRAPQIWLDRVATDGHGYHPFEEIDALARAWETILMGLRLREGLPFKRIEEEAGTDWKKLIDEKMLDRYVEAGFIKRTDAYIALQPPGFQRLEGILRDIVITA